MDDGDISSTFEPYVLFKWFWLYPGNYRVTGSVSFVEFRVTQLDTHIISSSHNYYRCQLSIFLHVAACGCGNVVTVLFMIHKFEAANI